MDQKVGHVIKELETERERSSKLENDLESLASDYEKKKCELNQFTEQKNELVQLSRVQVCQIFIAFIAFIYS